MFINITKANARISELENEVAAAQAIVEAAAGHESTIADLRGQLEQATARITELSEQNDQFAASVNEAAETIRERDERIADLSGEVEQLQADFKTAEAQAADIVAAQGLSAEDIQPVGQSAKVDHLAEYQAITDPVERGRYRAAHRKEIENAVRN